MEIPSPIQGVDVNEAFAELAAEMGRLKVDLILAQLDNRRLLQVITMLQTQVNAKEVKTDEGIKQHSTKPGKG